MGGEWVVFFFVCMQHSTIKKKIHNLHFKKRSKKEFLKNIPMLNFFTYYHAICGGI